MIRSGGREQTLASWILRTPAEGPPQLRVVIANPGEPPVTRSVVLDHDFWDAAPPDLPTR
jgi:hypothetical protein